MRGEECRSRQPLDDVIIWSSQNLNYSNLESKKKKKIVYIYKNTPQSYRVNKFNVYIRPNSLYTFTLCMSSRKKNKTR